jgi:hypothetical protein
MLIPASGLALALQLLLPIAEGVPEFNIQRGCQVDSTGKSDLRVGLDESFKRCVRDEEAARDQLKAQWQQIPAPDRVMCSQSAQAASDATQPSYVDLLTCLQEQIAAKKLRQ